MIPKIIHYCWFGNNPKPKMLKKCMSSWNKICPEYRIIEWNESNVDLTDMPQYVMDAYKARKYAFVSDYVRLWIIYNNGGIYLDTDVELLKPLDDLLIYDGYFGFENQDNGKIASGLGFGAIKGLSILKELMEIYDKLVFTDPDNQRTFLPNTQINWPIFEKHGVKIVDHCQIIDENVLILPGDYLDPMTSYLRDEIKITKNTYSIHRYSMTWETNHEGKIKKMKKAKQVSRFKNYIKRIIGEKLYYKIKEIKNKIICSNYDE